MLSYATILRHYKKSWIQKEILRTAQEREVAIRYGQGMGKRPDVLIYPRDVFEHAKNKATSFHISEERWHNPLALSPQLKKEELNALRKGWDLVIDVDFPHWEATKLITYKIIEALQYHGIKSISCKFSGNKGFHIGVPYEAFPQHVHNQPLSALFPEGVKRVVEYIIYFLDNEKNNYALSQELLTFGDAIASDTETVCSKCGTPFLKPQKETYEYLCNACGYAVTTERFEEYKQCPQCNHLMDVHSNKPTCTHCGNTTFVQRVNLKIDTMLISQRHLYRSVYSLHEKSGLVSVPLDPEKVLSFEKEAAHPDKLPKELTSFYERFRFLDATKAHPGEAERLIIQAFDYQPKIHEHNQKIQTPSFSSDYYTEPDLTEKIPLEFFPPSIKAILQGLEDGRKRALFILMNFLRNMGWQFDEIEALIYEWNQKNAEPLREAYIKGQLQYQKKQKQPMMPPNYDNKMYYEDLKILSEEERKSPFKNPVQWAKIKWKQQKKIKRTTAKKRKKAPAKEENYQK